MSEQLIQLQRLQALLHEVNEELARAARPIRRLSELSDEQRQDVAAELRSGLARWESVTQQISQVLGGNGATGVPGAKTTMAERDDDPEPDLHPRPGRGDCD